MPYGREKGDKESIFVEKINNVIGSTAGAGSGEYYTYRNQRRDDLAAENQKLKDDIVQKREEEFLKRNKIGVLYPT